MERSCESSLTAATTGKLNGFVSGMKSDDPRILYVHCIIHRHNLAVSNIRGDIQHVLNTAMHAIYFVKSNSVSEFSCAILSIYTFRNYVASH